MNKPRRITWEVVIIALIAVVAVMLVQQYYF